MPGSDAASCPSCRLTPVPVRVSTTSAAGARTTSPGSLLLLQSTAFPHFQDPPIGRRLVERPGPLRRVGGGVVEDRHVVAVAADDAEHARLLLLLADVPVDSGRLLRAVHVHQVVAPV